MNRISFFTIAIVCFLSYNSYSQFTFQRTSPLWVHQNADSLQVESYATVNNTGDSTIHIQIDVYILSSVGGLDTLVGVCDWFNCHPPGYFHYSTNCSTGSHTFDVYANIINQQLFYGMVQVIMTSNGVKDTVDFGLSTEPNGIKQINSTISDFKLGQNYPNPFNPSTKIQFSIPKNDMVDLRVYDILGREVAVIYSQYTLAGSYEVEWNAKNFASGIYYYKLRTKDNVSVKKMTLVK